uniref:Uncharacterized protein n=1 Tax=Cacopsylla melanoneura TaxID=428564 RepID=A0A8D9ENV9_9HEMI
MMGFPNRSVLPVQGSVVSPGPRLAAFGQGMVGLTLASGGQKVTRGKSARLPLKFNLPSVGPVSHMTEKYNTMRLDVVMMRVSIDLSESFIPTRDLSIHILCIIFTKHLVSY